MIRNSRRGVVSRHKIGRVSAPLLGEHTSEVLIELAGLTSDDIAELVIDDVVGTVPIAAR